MIDKLKDIKERFEAVQEEMSKPEVVGDMEKFIRLNKEYKQLVPIVRTTDDYLKVLNDIESARSLLDEEKDDEFRAFAKSELDKLMERKSLLEEEIRILLIPKDPEDAKNAVVEIRAGTGGDEAGLFAGDLYRMYLKYCESKRWKTELVDFTEGTMGGFKEVIFNVIGEDVYGLLKYESGVHRVQRVPHTETQGRVHTSAASVVVLPEAEEFDLELDMNDIRRDEFCSSGPGGQSVNTTYSAIRLTHLPTGTVVQCQDEKSKLKNYDKALKVLRSRLYEMEMQKRMNEESAKRKTMVSTGDRSAKIRTYNWPQGRVTDHRIGLTMHNLQNVIDGDIQDLLDALKLADNAEKLKEGYTEG